MIRTAESGLTVSIVPTAGKYSMFHMQIRLTVLNFGNFNGTDRLPRNGNLKKYNHRRKQPVKQPGKFPGLFF